MCGFKQTASFVLFTALIAFGALTSPVSAFDSSQRGYGAMLRAADQGARVPASYRIVRDTRQQPAELVGNARYLGGRHRIVLVDGKPVKMPESEIVENIRKGHFVPVYQDSGERLNREDWLVSLPGWLGQATIQAAR